MCNCGPELARGRLTASRERSGGLLPRVWSPCVRGLRAPCSAKVLQDLFSLANIIFMTNSSRRVFPLFRFEACLINFMFCLSALGLWCPGQRSWLIVLARRVRYGAHRATHGIKRETPAMIVASLPGGAAH